MFTKQSEMLANVLIENEISKAEDKEIIIYGFSAGIELLFNIITTLALGFVFGLVFESIIFLFSFSFIRTYAGGYHCQKAVNCYFFSSGIIVLILTVVKITPTWYMLPISVFILFVSIPVILKFAPIGATNKPLDEVEKQHYRKITIHNLSSECVIILILLIAGLNNFAFVMSLAIMITAVVVVLQKQIMKQNLGGNL